MPLTFTAVFKEVPEGYIGFVEELPGANVQEATIEEARESLREAVALVIAANRELAQDGPDLPGTIREELVVEAA